MPSKTLTDTTLTALKAAIARQAEAQRHADHLTAVLAEHRQIMASATAHDGELATLQRQREDLLADQATGAVRDEDLRQLDQRIEPLKAQIAAARNAAADSADTVTGLQRRLEQARTEVQRTTALRDQGYRDHLKSLAQQAAADYLAAARRVDAGLARLAAIQQEANGHGREASIPLGPELRALYRDVEYLLPGLTELVGEGLDRGELRSTDKLAIASHDGLFDERVKAAVESLRAELAAQGIAR